MLTTLYLVRATHPIVPGQPASIHFTRGEADQRAVELVETMLLDFQDECLAASDEGYWLAGEPPLAPGEWGAWLRFLQVARIRDALNTDVADVEESANDQPHDDEWLADASGADVWIEEIKADMPLPRVLVQADHGVIRRVRIDRGHVDLLSVDADAIIAPACGVSGDDATVTGAFDRYWHPTPAPAVN